LIPLKVWSFLNAKEKARALLVLFCILAQGILETLSLGAVVPLLTLIARPEMVAQNSLLSSVHGFLGAPSSGDFLIIVSFFVVGCFLVKNVFIFFCDFVQVRFCLSVQSRLSTQMLRSLLSKDYSYFFKSNSSVLLRRVTNEVTAVCQSVLLYALILIAEMVTLSGILLLMLLANPQLSILLGLGASAIVCLIYFLIRLPARRIGERNQLTSNEIFRVASQSLQGVKEVKTFGRSSYFVERFEVFADQNARAATLNRVLNGTPRLVIEMAVIFGVTGIVIVSTLRGASPESLVPLLGLYAVSAYRIMPGASRVLSALSNFRFSAPSVEVIREALSESDSSNRFVGNESVPIAFERDLAFSDLSFSYQSGRPVLSGVSFELKKGRSLALVGPSGAGKSTIVDIALGLLTPASGSVLVDGLELSRRNVESWQQKLGYVPQQIFLLDDSLRRNIAFGIRDQDINEESIQRAVRMARLDELVEQLPSGLDTQIGERGVQLSGGQRQRVGIARALYNDPPILILDEATSALDSMTEAQFTEAIRALAGKKTMIIIAHRLSTVRNCDQILLVEGGRILARGSHDDLLTSSDLFRSMVAQQGVGLA
jgi:ATP-binding cassette, subfamily B, bacterial PglK